MWSVAYLAISSNTSCRVLHKKRCMIYGKTSTVSLKKLPLKYYDGRPVGETLSRVTNDIDTIGSTLQQSLTQFITSVVTIVGILIMMLYDQSGVNTYCARQFTFIDVWHSTDFENGHKNILPINSGRLVN